MVSAMQGKSEGGAGHVGWVGLVASGVYAAGAPTIGDARSINVHEIHPSKLCSQRENTLAIVGPLTAQMIPLESLEASLGGTQRWGR